MDCAFGCDSLASNQTLNAFTCKVVPNNITRLSFTTASILMVGTTLICLNWREETVTVTDVVSYHVPGEVLKIRAAVHSNSAAVQF